MDSSNPQPSQPQQREPLTAERIAQEAQVSWEDLAAMLERIRVTNPALYTLLVAKPIQGGFEE